MIFVIATSVLKEGCREQFINLTKENYAKVHAEEGCISYTLTSDCDSGMEKQKKFGENTVVFVECWESLDALKKHLAAPHMKAFGAAAAELRVSSELRIVQPV